MPFYLTRFADSMQEYTYQDVYEKLVADRELYESLATPVQTARWIGSLIGDLTIELGPDEAKKVMEACGKKCFGQSIIRKAIQLRKESRDIDDLLDKLNQTHIGGGRLHRDGNLVHASYERCYCGSVSKTRQPISTVYCQCSCGWYQKLFETILGKPVQVELIDSIIHGAETCQFVIYV
jgi:predicted hydrocarbon binding protein